MTGDGRRVYLTVVAVALGSLGLASCTGLLLLLQPRWLVDGIARLSPRVVFFVETEDPLVALTIDDGPDPETTPRLLRLLERHDARATFFLIGERISGNEGLVERMLAGGHEVGNHMAQDRPSVLLSPDEFEAALLQVDSLLSRFADPRWARPGSGWHTDTMLSVMERHGYRCALGSIYPYDGTLGFTSYAVWLVLRRVRPGSIIVLHDGGGRGGRTIAALEEILPGLGRRGLRVVTLSELTAAAQGRSPRPAK